MQKPEAAIGLAALAILIILVVVATRLVLFVGLEVFGKILLPRVVAFCVAALLFPDIVVAPFAATARVVSYIANTTSVLATKHWQTGAGDDSGGDHRHCSCERGWG